MEVKKISSKEASVIKDIINAHRSLKTPLLEILHGINGIYKCIPLHASIMISEELGITLSQVNETATFYDFLSVEPLGDTVFRVCEGASCVVNGAEDLTKALRNKFSLVDSHTTEDNKYTVEITYCNGYCDKSPTITVNAKLFTNVDVFKLGEIVREEYDN